MPACEMPVMVGTTVADVYLLSMQAHKAILETDENGRLSGLPTLPPRAAPVAVIFLYSETVPVATVRRPPCELAGLEIKSDVTAPVIDLQDWNLDS
jgi:hypothetical protein